MRLKNETNIYLLKIFFFKRNIYNSEINNECLACKSMKIFYFSKQGSVRIKEDYKMHTYKLLNIEVLLKDKCVKMSCACLL